MSEKRAYRPATVIAAQRRVLAMAAKVLRSEFPKGMDRDRLCAYDGTLITIGEVLHHIDSARKLKVQL